jgi:hypothetical protein
VPFTFTLGCAAMYRYQPPKSSIWGHSLGRMQAARQKALFSEFLARAVDAYSFSSGVLNILDASLREDTRRFENIFGAVTDDNYCHTLTSRQFEQCLNEIIEHNALEPCLLLMQALNISAWSINGQAIATNSMLNLYYGVKPCISTLFLFDTVEHFQYVKQILEDLHFCTLNEKHLKAIKLGAKTNAA